MAEWKVDPDKMDTYKDRIYQLSPVSAKFMLSLIFHGYSMQYCLEQAEKFETQGE